MSKKVKHAPRSKEQPSVGDAEIPSEITSSERRKVLKGKGGLTAGQRALVHDFKVHLKAVRAYDIDSGDDSSEIEELMEKYDLDEEDAEAVIAGNEGDRVTLRRQMSQHGFGMYLDLAADPRTKARADKLLQRDHQKRAELGLDTPLKKPVDLGVVAEAFTGEQWEANLDPTRLRRKPSNRPPKEQM